MRRVGSSGPRRRDQLVINDVRRHSPPGRLDTLPMFCWLSRPPRRAAARASTTNRAPWSGLSFSGILVVFVTVNVFPQISEWRYEGIVLLFCLDVERLRREQFWPGLTGVANDEPSSESVEFARPTPTVWTLFLQEFGATNGRIHNSNSLIQLLKMMMLSAFLVLALLGGVNGQPTASYVNDPEAILATRSTHARTHASAPRSLQRRPYLQRRGGQRC